MGNTNKHNAKKPLVTVIIPCYNEEKFIGKAIESIQAQTIQDWELIVVDDCSTDKTIAITEKYFADTRIKLVKNITNRGISFTKNAGIKNSKGSYVAFLDADDTWLHNKLELQLNAFDCDDKAGVVCTGMVITDYEDRKIGLFLGYDDANQEELLKNIYFDMINSSSLMMLKTEALLQLGTFNEDIIGWDDYELLMRFATRFRIKYVRQPLVIKVEHPANVERKDSHDSPAVHAQTKKIFNHIVELHPFLLKYRSAKEAALLFVETLELLKQGNKPAAKKNLRLCLRLKPLYPNLWILYAISTLPGNLPSRTLYMISKTISSIKSMQANFKYKEKT